MSYSAFSGISINDNVTTADPMHGSAAVVPLNVGVWRGNHPILEGVDETDAPLDLSSQMFVGSFSQRNVECAAGLKPCPSKFRSVFCPEGPLRPRTANDLYEDNCIEREASLLWGKSLNDFVNEKGERVKLRQQGHSTSFGAMLAAIHPAGHSCLSYAVYYLTGCKIPHVITTLSGASSYLRRCRYRPTESNARLARLIISYVDYKTEHVVLVPSTLEAGMYHTQESFGANMTLRVYATIPKACERDEITAVTCGGGPDGPENCCPKLSVDTIYCHICNVVVSAEGHDARCKPVTAVDEKVVMGIIMRRAQLGDCYHRADVLVALMHKAVPDDKRTNEVNTWVAGAAQAAYMRGLGHVGPDRVLSTWFECMYPEFRGAYLKAVFPDVPACMYPRIVPFEDMLLDDGVLVYSGKPVVAPRDWDEVYQAVTGCTEEFTSLDTIAYDFGVAVGADGFDTGVPLNVTNHWRRQFQSKRRSATVEADRVEVRKTLAEARVNGDDAAVGNAKRALRRLGKEYRAAVQNEDAEFCLLGN